MSCLLWRRSHSIWIFKERGEEVRRFSVLGVHTKPTLYAVAVCRVVLLPFFSGGRVKCSGRLE